MRRGEEEKKKKTVEDSSLTRRLQYSHHLTVSSLPRLVQRSFPVLVSQVRVSSVTQQSLQTQRHTHKKSERRDDLNVCNPAVMIEIL